MPYEEQSRNKPKREFFYSELASFWKDDGLENQAYILVKHVNMSFEAVCRMTLVEREAYVGLLRKEREREREELEQVKRKKN